MEDSYKFAKDFNEEIPLRYSLWTNGKKYVYKMFYDRYKNKKIGFMSDMKQLPGLLKQEREALSCYCVILFKHYQMNKDTEQSKEILDLFLK